MSGSPFNYQFNGQFGSGTGAATLFTYAQQVRRLVADPTFKLIQEQDLYFYINQARRETAMRAECVRYLPPTSGAITSYSIVTPGVSYTSPTITLSPPDYPPGTPQYANGLQATATATVTGGTISAVNADSYDAGTSVKDPRGPTSGTERVLRGGSWKSSEDSCRCSARHSEAPGFADVCFGYEAYGFRCVRRVPGDGSAL